MNFWDELKNNFNTSLILPLFISAVLIVFAQSLPSVLGNGYDDVERISLQAAVFFATLIIGGIAKFYFFFVLGKKKDILKDRSFSDFISKLFVEWIVVEIRIQLRTLFYLLLLIIPGLIEALRLSLAPVHVFFNPEMEHEDFDPVLSSRKTLDFNEIKTLAALFFINIFVLGLQFAVTGGSLFSSGTQLLKAILCIFITALTSYIYYVYISYLYFHYSNKQS